MITELDHIFKAQNEVLDEEYENQIHSKADALK